MWNDDSLGNSVIRIFRSSYIFNSESEMSWMQFQFTKAKKIWNARHYVVLLKRIKRKREKKLWQLTGAKMFCNVKSCQYETLYHTIQMTIYSLIWESTQTITLFSYSQIRVGHLNLCFKNHSISHFISKIMVIKNDTWLTRKWKLPSTSRLWESLGSLWLGSF